MDIESRNLLAAAANSAGWAMVASAKLLKEQQQLRKANKKWSCWVRSWRERKEACGNIQFLLMEYKLANDMQSYKRYLLMDEVCFQELLTHIKDDITKRDTHMRKCIPAPERLAATLRFLATGEDYKELSENTKLSSSFLRANIIGICEVIYKTLAEKYLKFPDAKEKWLQIAAEFEAKWQFPNCIGALDGKHVAMTPSKSDSALFYNYKGFHSVVLLAMADANAKFIVIDVGRNGRISDGGIFRRCALRNIVDDGEKYFPQERSIGNNRTLS